MRMRNFVVIVVVVVYLFVVYLLVCCLYFLSSAYKNVNNKYQSSPNSTTLAHLPTCICVYIINTNTITANRTKKAHERISGSDRISKPKTGNINNDNI